MPNAPEIAALYDTYKLDKVEITWISNKQNAEASLSSLNFDYGPRFYVANDYTADFGASLLGIQEQVDCKAFMNSDGTENKWDVITRYTRYHTIHTMQTNKLINKILIFLNKHFTIPHHFTHDTTVRQKSIHKKILNRLE
jgi:hypothetical protein